MSKVVEREVALRALIGVETAALTFSERNNTALVTAVISVTANYSITISFQVRNTIARVHNCLKLLSCMVIETAMDGMRKNQLF